MSTATTLMTAEEYARMEDRGVPTELVRGEIVETNQPMPRHGEVCLKVGRIIGNFVEEHDLGRVAGNDAGILTERDPDTVRGGDVWFVGYDKVPRQPLSTKYLDVAPDIVFEVRSDSDRWTKVLGKVVEYINAGVPVVCVLDPKAETAWLYYQDAPEVQLSSDDELTFPQQLPGFSVRVGRLFE